MSEHDDYPACPKCGSIHVTAVQAPHLISAADGGTQLQTQDHALQCICGAVFTVSNEHSENQNSFEEFEVSEISQSLRTKKPR